MTVKLKKQVGLIGADNWNPYGESSLSIVQSIRMENYFSLKEIGLLFGLKGRQSFSIDSRRQPNICGVIDLKKLCDTAGWEESLLDASFSSYYFPNLSDIRGKSRTRKEIRHGLYLDRIRLCPVCAEHGVHLIFHQLLGWVSCPLHQITLIDRCPDCGIPTHRYEHNERRQSFITQCDKCGWGSRPNRNINVDDRVKAIQQYREWLNQIENVYNGDNPKKIWIGRPDLLGNSAQVNELLPGPEWLGSCLLDTKRVRSNFKKHDNLNFLSPAGFSYEQLPTNTLQWNILNPGKSLNSTKCFYSAISKQNRYICKTIENSLISKLNITDLSSVGAYARYGADRVNLSITGYTQVSYTAFSLWQLYVEYMSQKHRYFKGDIANDYHYFDSCFWPIWREGPGALIWREYIKKEIPWENTILCLWVDYHWREQFLLNLYYSFITYIGTLVLNTNQLSLDLLSDIYQYSDRCIELPLSILECSQDTVTFRTATILAKNETFDRFIKSEEPGYQYKFLQETRREENQLPPLEILELFGFENEIELNTELALAQRPSISTG